MVGRARSHAWRAIEWLRNLRMLSSLDWAGHGGQIVEVAHRLKVPAAYQQVNLEAVGSLGVREGFVNVVELTVPTSLYCNLCVRSFRVCAVCVWCMGVSESRPPCTR